MQIDDQYQVRSAVETRNHFTFSLVSEYYHHCHSKCHVTEPFTGPLLIYDLEKIENGRNFVKDNMY